MRKDAPAIFRMAEAEGIRYGFTNNGTLFERKWPELVGLRPFSASFSLDSPIPEEHNAWRKLPDNWNQIHRGVALARADGWAISLMFTVTPKTFPRIEQMLELGDSWDCPIVLNPMFSYKNVGGNLSREQLLEMRSYVWDRRATVDASYLKWLAEGRGNQTNDRTCKSMDTHVVVAPDSTLYAPCYHYAQTRVPTPTGIYNAVRSEAWREMAEKAGRYEFCNGCAINCYLEEAIALRHPVSTPFWMLLHLAKIKRGRGRAAAALPAVPAPTPVGLQGRT